MALFVARSFSILHSLGVSCMIVVEKKFDLIDSKFISPFRNGFVVDCMSLTNLFNPPLCSLFVGGLIRGIWELAAGADICLRGIGRGIDFIAGAEVIDDFCSKPSCLLIVDADDAEDDDEFLDFNFVAKGKGAGLSGCGGMDSSVVHGGVGMAETNSPSYVLLSTDSNRLKLPVLPSKISDPDCTCCAPFSLSYVWMYTKEVK